MLSQTDAALSNMQSAPWPDPRDYPMPVPLEARASAVKLLSSGLFALALAGMIGLMLRENAQTAQAYEGWRLWLRIAAVLGIAGLGVTILIAGIKAITDPAPLVSLTQAGLLIPGFYSRTVPWSEIMQAVHDKPRVKLFGPGHVVLGVRDGARFGRIDSQDLKPALGPGGLDAAQLPQILDIPVDGLFARIQGYRAHFGQGGASGNSD